MATTAFYGVAQSMPGKTRGRMVGAQELCLPCNLPLLQRGNSAASRFFLLCMGLFSIFLFWALPATAEGAPCRVRGGTARDPGYAALSGTDKNNPATYPCGRKHR
jgi:hypothetical protein